MINAIYIFFYNESAYIEVGGVSRHDHHINEILATDKLSARTTCEQAYRKPCTKRENLHLTQLLFLLCH